MAPRIRALLAVLVLLAPAAARAQVPVEYRLSFPEAEHRLMSVEVVFGDVPAGTLELRMSRSSPGRYALHQFAKNVFDVRVTDAAGFGVEMVWDAACPWVQIHTSDKGVGKPGHRTGLAVEPMTCAPDAFNAASYDYDTGLIVLEPGASSEASWRIAAIV